MADFYQDGLISTLHRFGNTHPLDLEKKLQKYAKQRPIALVLPSTYSDLLEEPFKVILEELKGVKYLKEIVLTMGVAEKAECLKKAKKMLEVLPQRSCVVWNNGKRIKELHKLLDKHHLNIGPDGKGRSVWMAYGYILSKGECEVIAIHDCDIVSYSQEFLTRLCYPVVNPNFDYAYCKGFYSRVTDRMYGRVTRLFVTPLIRTLQSVIGYNRFLVYLDSFRYPLAGEFSITSDLTRINRVPGDWGLEVGTLAEIYRNCSLKRVCQVDLCDRYEHKHQPLSPDDPMKGLLRMSIDIGKVLFRTLSSEGVVFTDGLFKTIISTYVRAAQDMIKSYDADADINNLYFDRHEEAAAVEAFTEAIRKASDEFMCDPLGIPQIPNWNRVTSAIPEFLPMLEEAVEKDNA